MTISAAYSADNYAGNGSTTVFAVTFAFLSTATNLKVSIKVDSTGVITTQTLTTHYTVSGSNVTMITAPASGETLIIELNPDFKQTSDYAENSAFPAETLETDLDERTLEGQINNDNVDRSLKIDASVTGVDGTIVASSTNATNASKFVRFNSAGDGFEVQALSATAGLADIVDDTTPQLGGDLDANGKNILFDDATGIQDSNGNEQLTFQETASAINQLEITNAAAGSEPRLAATGDDTNVSLELAGQGTGTINVVGNATQSGAIRIYEDTDQGSAYVGLTVPSNTGTPSVTYSLPDGDGSSGDVLSTDGSAVMSWITPVTASSTTTFTNKTFDANATGNSLSNVDVADLANGTDGELITWDASAAPTTVAAGTSGQVLTSNGAGAAPTFQAAAGAGKVGQVLQTVLSSTFSTTSTTMTDLTGLSVTITPTATSSKILVMYTVMSGAGIYRYCAQLVRDSTAIAIGDTAGSRTRSSTAGLGTANEVNSESMTFLDSPSTTSATTYKVQGLVESGGTLYINRSSADSDAATLPRGASTITVMEILA